MNTRMHIYIGNFIAICITKRNAPCLYIKDDTCATLEHFLSERAKRIIAYERTVQAIEW